MLIDYGGVDHGNIQSVPCKNGVLYGSGTNKLQDVFIKNISRMRKHVCVDLRWNVIPFLMASFDIIFI